MKSSRTGNAGAQQPFASMEKTNAELLSFTYGAVVRQLVSDLQDAEEVNKQLDKMGYNIGIRIIDEFLAKSGARCGSFREAMETIAKVGFKMFLGVTATCSNWSTDASGSASECSLVLEEIPFVEYVELPASLSELRYSNILCGVIKGALEQIGIKVDVNFVKDMLRGDDAYEMRVVLVEAVPDEFPFKDDE